MEPPILPIILYNPFASCPSLKTYLIMLPFKSFYIYKADVVFRKPPKKLTVTATELSMSSLLLGLAYAIASPIPLAIPLSHWIAVPKSKLLI